MGCCSSKATDEHQHRKRRQRASASTPHSQGNSRSLNHHQAASTNGPIATFLSRISQSIGGNAAIDGEMESMRNIYNQNMIGSHHIPMQTTLRVAGTIFPTTEIQMSLESSLDVSLSFLTCFQVKTSRERYRLILDQRPYKHQFSRKSRMQVALYQRGPCQPLLQKPPCLIKRLMVLG